MPCGKNTNRQHIYKCNFAFLPDSLSGNLTATISDHLPQFLIVPNIFPNSPSNNSNICERQTGLILIKKILFLIIFLLSIGMKH